jgi:hypothetical protein
MNVTTYTGQGGSPGYATIGVNYSGAVGDYVYMYVEWEGENDLGSGVPPSGGNSMSAYSTPDSTIYAQGRATQNTPWEDVYGSSVGVKTYPNPVTLTSMSVGTIKRDRVTVSFRWSPQCYESSGTATIQKSLNGSSWSDTTAVTASRGGAANYDEALVVTGLSPATLYYFRIKASRNTLGDSLSYHSLGTTGTTKTAQSASTSAASNVTSGGARLNGSINPNSGGALKYKFEYGTTVGYGSETTEQDQADAGTDQAVYADVSSLDANVTYHFRIKTYDGDYIVYGSDAEFLTSEGDKVAYYI